MGDERSRVHSWSSTHFEQSSRFALIVFDEEDVFADKQVNDIADAGVNDLPAAGIGYKYNFGSGGCYD